MGERCTHSEVWLIMLDWGKESGSHVWRWVPTVRVLRRVLAWGMEDLFVLPRANLTILHFPKNLKYTHQKKLLFNYSGKI